MSWQRAGRTQARFAFLRCLQIRRPGSRHDCGTGHTEDATSPAVAVDRHRGTAPGEKNPGSANPRDRVIDDAMPTAGTRGRRSAACGQPRRSGSPGTSSLPSMTASAILIFASMPACPIITIRCACGEPAPCMASTIVVTLVMFSM